MDIHWHKAEGQPPDGEVLAVDAEGQYFIGTIGTQPDGSWTCYNSEYHLHDVRWYISLAQLLATVPQ